MPTPHPASSDLPPAHGVTLTAHGADVAVYAREADAVELCLFDEGDTTGESERRVPLTNRAHGTWFDHVDGLRAGQRYGFRAHGRWDPRAGYRFNPAKLLIDPYALGIEGEVTWRPEVYGHTVGADLRGDPLTRDDRDSAPFVPRSVVLERTFAWGDDAAPGVPLSSSVVYETHVRSLTKRMPGIPEKIRGTYAAMAHPSVVEHLHAVGVTAVELLPIHSFTSEPRLVQQGLTNHWGYNTLGFLAPHAGYAAASTPQGVLDEVKTMVKRLHAAGIEVLLDVVYNHSAEQGVDGATLAYRGLDAPAYYRLDGRGHDIDVTGCGNTLDLNQTPAIRLVLDSLRYWVQDVHVDGFRFDLAVALGRGRDDGFDPHHPLFVALRTDPVLSRVKLVAEPWDIGFNGWRTGQFPPPFSEWNDRFRDSVRTFWLSDVASVAAGGGGHGVSGLASALTGSQELFDNRDRDTNASVNFVAAHDGFTLADLTTYDGKHNGANGEDNRDGTTDNRSWNHGTEGAADDATHARRARSMRNLLGTLLLSAGVPMINAGDELGRSQRGNNNPYCQDNPISWFDWDLAPWQRDLLATTGHLTRLRADLPVLRQRAFFGGRIHKEGTTDLRWFTRSGVAMEGWEWNDPGTRALTAFFDGRVVEDDSVLVVLDGGVGTEGVTLPVVEGVGDYELLWDSSWDRPARTTTGHEPGTRYVAEGPSMQVFRARP